MSSSLDKLWKALGNFMNGSRSKFGLRHNIRTVDPAVIRIEAVVTSVGEVGFSGLSSVRVVRGIVIGMFCRAPRRLESFPPKLVHADRLSVR
jgi:hypothetical protein